VYRRIHHVALTAALLLAAAPGAAHAAKVDANASWLAFKADTGEVNDLHATQNGDSITFEDPGKTINARGAGSVCGAPENGKITCTPGARELKIALDDGDDTYTSQVSVTGKIDAGAGADRVLARDGVSEEIACGTETDFAEIDPLDVTDVDCETVDHGGTRDEPGDGTGDGDGSGGAGTPPPPQLGRSVTVAPARGVVTVRQPGARTVVLRAGDDIPLGSIVDTRRGAVTLTSAADANGKTQTARFSRGVFKVRQTEGTRPVTELVLKGRLACGKKSARSRGKLIAARGKRARRRLWGSGHGRFRTRGRRSSATVRGTVWLTEDRCNGTYTKVRRGVVAVKDFRTGKTQLVRAGKSYLAQTKRAARRKRR